MTERTGYLQVILTVILFTLFSFVSVFAWSKEARTEAGLPSELTQDPTRSAQNGLDLASAIEESFENQAELHETIQKQVQISYQGLENEPVYKRSSQFSRIRRTADSRSLNNNQDGLQIRLVKSRKVKN